MMKMNIGMRKFSLWKTTERKRGVTVLISSKKPLDRLNIVLLELTSSRGLEVTLSFLFTLDPSKDTASLTEPENNDIISLASGKNAQDARDATNIHGLLAQVVRAQS